MDINPFMARKLAIRPLGLRHNGHNRVNEGFIPIASDPFLSYLFIPLCHAPRKLFPIENLSPHTTLSLYCDHHSSDLSLVTVSKLPPPEPEIVNPEHVCRTSWALQKELLRNFWSIWWLKESCRREDYPQVYKHHPQEDFQPLCQLLELDHLGHQMRSKLSTGMITQMLSWSRAYYPPIYHLWVVQ